MSRKRIFDVINSELFQPILHQKKKFKKSWISGTSVHNYLQKEPLLDWLNLYHRNNTHNLNTVNNSQSIKLLFSKGNDFENKIYDDILIRYPTQSKKIFLTPGGIILESDFQKTLEAMKDEIPILLQVPLMNNTLKLRGVADIVIRSDWVNRLYKREVIPVNEIKTPEQKFYYVVIDIKYTSMTLCANGYTIRNDGRFKGYKGQLLIYNIAVGLIQNYIPTKAYIMSKNWKIDKKNQIQEGFDCYDLLGVIDYNNFDRQYIQSTSDAICWINKVRQYGSKWDPLNPKIPELCVNMCNVNDDPWHSVKRNILEETKDLTAIWMVTPENRSKAFAKGITKYVDNKCTIEALGLEPTNKKTKIIDSILKINQQNEIKILPKHIKDNRNNWKTEYPTDFYIDFETINDIFVEDTINIHDARTRGTFIFMIGVYYKVNIGEKVNGEINSEYKYKCFKAKKYKEKEEKRIINKFITFINNIKAEFDPDNSYPIRFFHWSHCENTLLTSALIKHQLTFTNIYWIDLCDIFIKEPIVINGLTNFKLKDVAKAMKVHGMIETEWDSTSAVTDGLNAMQMAGRYYIKKRQQTLTENDKKIFQEIIKYNEIDCKVMCDITNYLRKIELNNN
jgi:hypothetical protein